ncbi:MAG TPA: SDR family NAD(P)-dependent oxidoreductase, partial [Clostridia bacterium]|nr:SDR family NAD(P)-dependent oxidoreductase [Clostridia bacterium]
MSEKKVALITGASRGIGRAIAEKLARNGMDIAVNYKGNVDSAIEVQKIIQKYGAESVLCQADVTDFSETKRMSEEVIGKFGRIDILVNNAGIARNSLFKDMSLKDWNSVIDTNLTGVFNVCKAVTPYMIGQKYGKIVNISSIGGIIAIDGIGNYSPSKAGVMAFTRVLGRELIQNNINVNCIAPGLVNTDLLMKDVDES